MHEHPRIKAHLTRASVDGDKLFLLDEAGRATRLRLGSEVDMGTPDFD